MKLFYTFILFLFASATSFAQQLSTSSLFDMHGILHNPAIAGSNTYGSIGGSFKTQWSGMPGGPKTALIFGNTYLQNIKLGIGGYLYNDVTGPTRRTGLQMAYAYHININETSKFSIGLEGRFQQFSFDRSKLQETLGNDAVLSSDEDKIKGDAGFGLAFTNKNLQVGASVSQLIQSKFNTYEASNTNDNSRLYRHYYLHGNYKWNVDQSTTITPNLLFIYLPNAPLEVQGGARVEHNKTFWYGLSWHLKQAWMLSAGLRLKEKFNLGYSFDIYSNPLSVYDKGSNGHEIMLRYDFIK